MSITKDLTIRQGKTFTIVVRWEIEPIVRKAISGISLASGAPRPNVVGHGCPSGWRAAVTRVKGMTQINAKNTPPKDDDYYPVTVIDVDHIEFNTITPVDDNGREWPAWAEGGFIEYFTPADLSGVTGRFYIKDRVGGTVIASSEVANAPKNIVSVAVNNTNKTIAVTIAATDTDDLSFKNAVYELEMESTSGVVTTLLEGKVALVKEVAV